MLKPNFFLFKTNVIILITSFYRKMFKIVDSYININISSKAEVAKTMTLFGTVTVFG